MIRINLLPSEARKKTSSPGQKLSIPVRPIAIGAGGLLAALTVVLVVGNLWNGGRLGRLKKEWTELQPRKAGLEKMQSELKVLQGRAGVLEQVKAPRGRWAPRLNLISDAVVSQVWFTKLGVAPGEPVRLQGSALVDGSGESGAAVTRFLQSLKDQPSFQEWFSAVELKSVQQKQIGQEDVVDFSILLTVAG
ncbi:MAG: PilN domain-containing protein [Candidatus Omnitrophica bacterium]|nr:PilN domain-containing protein [Candidatus Omnitrophota bacterium]